MKYMNMIVFHFYETFSLKQMQPNNYHDNNL